MAKSILLALPIAIAFGFMLSVEERHGDVRAFVLLIEESLRQDKTDTVEFSELVGHQVSIVCRLPEYVSVRQAAEEAAIPADTVPNLRVLELHWGLIVIGPTRTSYR